ncbi:MAG TPA: DUF1015 domain-containing protein [Candidatus Sulfopaludibacter sp.]|nr:DUF1015 domain-containing protein [Candidatus Sulfopaludibacter sp.]
MVIWKLARIYPFQPYRYTEKAGPLGNLATQPYDKISPAMRQRYLALSPYNLVRVILGESQPGDSAADNVYTRASAFLNDWIASGILARDAEPGVFPYFQEFTVPDTGERLVRKGFIALGAVEDYSAGVVHRHEQTLSGPKKDRLELLRHTHAHFGQIFMLYPDPARSIDALLDEAAQAAPLAEAADEYAVIHRVWKIAGAARIQALMAEKKLVIADGHHRYETAMAFRDENPNLPGAGRVMMTFINMYSPGLKILATHRLVSGVETAGFLERAGADFRVEAIASLDRLRQAWSEPDGRTVIGAAIGERLYLLEDRSARGALDVRVLHEKLLGKALAIDEAAVRDEKHLRYIRGIDAAVEEARKGSAQIAFLLKATSIQQVADTSFAGGVMPQKSTDFYPKVLSGLTIYKLD